MNRLLALQKRGGRGVDVLESGIPSGVRGPLQRLLQCREPIPRACSSRSTIVALTCHPWIVNAVASFALLLHVHRNGKVGSPRVTGSTKASALPSDRLYRFDLGSTCAGQTQATCRCPALKIQKMRALSIGHQDEGITGGLEDRMRSRTAAIE